MFEESFALPDEWLRASASHHLSCPGQGVQFMLISWAILKWCTSLGRFGAGKTPFKSPLRAYVPTMPPHVEQSQGKELPEVASERLNPLGLGGSFLQSSYHDDGQAPMNAR